MKTPKIPSIPPEEMLTMHTRPTPTSQLAVLDIEPDPFPSPKIVYRPLKTPILPPRKLSANSMRAVRESNLELDSFVEQVDESGDSILVVDSWWVRLKRWFGFYS